MADAWDMVRPVSEICPATASYTRPQLVRPAQIQEERTMSNGDSTAQAQQGFCLEEATMEQLHAAIRAGQITCVQVVQHYIDRVRAYNGVASVLVTADGKPVEAATGAVRGTAPLRFPTETVKAADVLPDLDRYRGAPIAYGRRE